LRTRITLRSDAHGIVGSWTCDLRRRERPAARPLQRLDALGRRVVRRRAVSGYALLRINPVNALGPPIKVAFAAKILFSC